MKRILIVMILFFLTGCKANEETLPMDRHADLNHINHIAVIHKDVERVSENWAFLCNTDLPDIQNFAGSGMKEKYRDELRSLSGKQVVFAQKDYYFEIKSPDLFGYNQEYYDSYGSGPAFLGLDQSENKSELIAYLKEKDCDVVDYIEYPYNYGDISIVDTRKLFSTAICINKYNQKQNPIENPQMDNFKEVCIIVNDFDQALKNFKDVFAVKAENITDVELNGEMIKSALIKIDNRYDIRLMENNGVSHEGIFFVSLAQEKLNKDVLNNFDLDVFCVLKAEKEYSILDSSDDLGIYIVLD